MQNPFRELLERRKAILFDGGMGTLLYSKGVFINRCYDELNLSAPELVLECHREYVRAGADVVETNTFGGNRFKLRGYGLEGRLEEINRSGVELARRAAQAEALVAGAVGPLGIRIEPWGPTSVEEAREAFREHIEALLKGGADLLILETFGDLSEMQQALQAAKEVGPGVPIIAQMTLQEDGHSLYGTGADVFTKRLEAWGADVVGVNCSVGPEVTLQAVEVMVGVTSLPVSAQPNAGVPRSVEGRNIYLASPDYFEEYAKRFLQTGVRIIGGCCGTTPDHIRSMRKALQAYSADERKASAAAATAVEVVSAVPLRVQVPLEQRSGLGRKLVEGKFITSMELVPPKGLDLTRLVARAAKAHEAGVDLINIPDGPRATARMSPLAMALTIRQSVGVEPLLHYTCRDRNLLGMQSDLLGMQALGIRNLLVITGDPPKMGDYPDATAVFDVDSIGLTNVVTRLNSGIDIGGNDVGDQTQFVVGVGVNPGAINMELELRRFYWKVEAGAHFAITQPVFDADHLEAFLETLARKQLKLPVLAGIWPLVSLRNAQFMSNEVPGAHVPEAVLKRMERAQAMGSEAAREEGVAIARETLERVRPLVQGIQISPPMGRIDLALSVLGVSNGRFLPLE